jgi:hypothetical protein
VNSLAVAGERPEGELSVHFKGIAAAAFVCAMAVGAAPASAGTIITATYTGTISLLLDKDGLLGTVVERHTASDLAFTNTFVFDLDEGDRLTQPIGGIPSDQLLGGSEYFGKAPLLSSKLTINGVTLEFLGGFATQQLTQQGVVVHSLVEDRSNDVWSANYIAIQANAPGLLTTPFAGAATGHAAWGGAAAICAAANGSCADMRFQVLFVPEYMTVNIESGSGSGAVPEPATWALMIAGFGLMGAALRRRVIAA